MKKEVRIALLAIVAVVMSIWGYNFVKGKNILSKSYTFYIKMDNTHGVEISTPVMINGLALGTVSALRLDKDMHSIIAVLDVSKKYIIPSKTTAEIVSTGLMGGKAINLSFNTVCSTDCAQSGDTLQFKVKGLIANMFGDDDITDYIGSVQKSIGGILDSLDSSLRRNADEDGLSKLVIDLQRTVSNLKITTETLNILLLNSTGSFGKMMEDLQSITGNIKSSNREISELIANVNGIAGSLNQSDLGFTLEELNQTLGKTQSAVEGLENTLDGADGLIDGLTELTSNLIEGEGSLGMLLKDERFYKNLDQSSKNLELLLQDLRLNPRRYLNLSIIGKKDKGYTPPLQDPAFQE
jgi:phospholipid/cholesterol/gamma-HCH transport system substrate-binding protein